MMTFEEIRQYVIKKTKNHYNNATVPISIFENEVVFGLEVDDPSPDNRWLIPDLFSFTRDGGFQIISNNLIDSNDIEKMVSKATDGFNPFYKFILTDEQKLEYQMLYFS